jgi:hypothetical protein
MLTKNKTIVTAIITINKNKGSFKVRLTIKIMDLFCLSQIFNNNLSLSITDLELSTIEKKIY